MLRIPGLVLRTGK